MLEWRRLDSGTLIFVGKSVGWLPLTPAVSCGGGKKQTPACAPFGEQEARVV